MLRMYAWHAKHLKKSPRNIRKLKINFHWDRAITYLELLGIAAAVVLAAFFLGWVFKWFMTLNWFGKVVFLAILFYNLKIIFNTFIE